MKKSFTEETIRQCMDKMVECYPHLNEGLCQFMNVLGKIKDNYNHLAYPYHPNWRYSYPILPNYTLKDGSVVDIGIHVESRLSADSLWRISGNIVTSNEGPDYYSGNISPTSEMYKVLMIQLRHWEFIDDAFILRRIADHNNFLEKFMQSDLTLWDMQDWIDGKS